MARVTVEDCLENVANRFALVHLTASRVRQMLKGSNPLVNCKNKEIVTALREIARGQVVPADIQGVEEEDLDIKIDISDL